MDNEELKFKLGEIITINSEQRKIASAETRRCIDFNNNKINDLLNGLEEE